MTMFTKKCDVPRRGEMMKVLKDVPVETGDVGGAGNVEIVTRSDVLMQMLSHQIIPKKAFVLVNMTGKDLDLWVREHELEIPSLDEGASVACLDNERQMDEASFAASGIPIRAEKISHILNLPEHHSGVYYIVSRDVAEAARLSRGTVDDLLVPGGEDEDGRILYLESLAQFEELAVSATFVAFRGFSTF